MTPKEILSKAHLAMKANDLMLASKLFTQILNSFPKHAAAKKGLQKIKRLTSSLDKANNNTTLEDAINELQKGQYQNAINLGFQYKLRDPNNPVVYNLIGISYVNLQNPEEAIPHFKTAIRLNKGYTEAKANLGSALLLLNKTEEAIVHLEDSIKENQKNPVAWNSLGNAKKSLGFSEDAEKAFKEAIKLNPNYINALNSYGVLLSEQREYKSSISIFETALRLDQNDKDLNQNYTDALSGDGQTEKAIEVLERMTENYGKNLNPNLLIQIADLEARIGNIEKSEILLKDVINSHPRLFEAYRSLSSIKKFQKSDKIITQMEDYFKSTTLSQEETIQLGFAVGKAFYDISEYDKSFWAYSRANTARREQLNYSTDEFSERIGIIKNTFDKKWFKKFENFKYQTNKPIFILGMNRSGTTLVEQIVSAHSLVTGGGEIPYLNLYGMKHLSNFENFKENDLKLFYEDYTEKLNLIDPIKPHVTDKMPLNFIWIGMIKTIFPKAKIIHLIREPMDTCLSNYRNYFSSSGNGFAYDQIELADFYAQYRNIMHYWYSLFPNEIFSCNYDKLVNNQEKVTRNILDYCELPWEPAVLNFHKNKRSVKTASVAQVRNPIYKSSISGWKKYEKHLTPMFNKLSESGCFEPWDIENLN